MHSRLSAGAVNQRIRYNNLVGFERSHSIPSEYRENIGISYVFDRIKVLFELNTKRSVSLTRHINPLV
jgi:hypothetical protein